MNFDWTNGQQTSIQSFMHWTNLVFCCCCYCCYCCYWYCCCCRHYYYDYYLNIDIDLRTHSNIYSHKDISLYASWSFSSTWVKSTDKCWWLHHNTNQLQSNLHLDSRYYQNRQLVTWTTSLLCPLSKTKNGFFSTHFHTMMSKSSEPLASDVPRRNNHYNHHHHHHHWNSVFIS